MASLKKLSPGDILLVARRWTRRGKNSEFTHFLSWFPGSPLISTEQAIGRPYFLLKKIAAWVGQDGYTSYSLGIELAAIFYMIRRRPRLVFFWYADHEYRFAWVIAKLLRIKIVGNFFFSIPEFERRMPRKGHLKYLNLVTASGTRQMEYLKNFVNPKKISLVPLGVDTRFFSPPLSSAARRTSRTLLHVGYNRRDFPTLKKVFTALKEKYPQLKMEMICADLVREMFQDLESVTIHNLLDDDGLLEAYQRASVLMLPLLEGGSSQTLNEAMATGLPIVTNLLPNLEDYAQGSGVLFSPQGDADSMVEHCEHLMENHSHWQDVSTAVRTHALKFDFARSREKLLIALKSVLNIELARPAHDS